MNELYSVKDTLCRELASYSNLTELSRRHLHDIDTLAHACKNVCKIIEFCEEEENEVPELYSSRRSNTNSYRRGRGTNGRYVSRRSYHSQPELVDELKHLMMDAPDETTRNDFQGLIQKLEVM